MIYVDQHTEEKKKFGTICFYGAAVEFTFTGGAFTEWKGAQNGTFKTVSFCWI